MELTGDILIGAPRAQVWAGLNNPEVLTRSIPGCESIEEVSSTEKSVRLMVKVGPVRARFVGLIRMEEIRPNEGCVMRFEGSGGPAGMATGHSNVELSAEGDATRLRYTVKAAVGGKLGQIGGRLIDAAAKQMADQFFTAFNQQLGAVPVTVGEPAAAAGLAPVPAAAPTTALSRAPQAAPAAPTGESTRVLWFVLGSLSTGFGMWLASVLFS